MLRLTASVAGVLRGLDIFSESVADVDGLLRDFAKVKRAEVRAIFAAAGPGWPALADNTLKRREEQRTNSREANATRAVSLMRSKLRRETKRAKRSGDQTTIARRMFVQAEFERLVRGGSAEVSLLAPVTADDKAAWKERSRITRELRTARKSGNEDRVEYLAAQLDRFDAAHEQALNVLADERVRKSITKLPERLKRAAEKWKDKPLGAIASSITAKIRKGSLTIESRIAWSGVHNEGGAAGHGANIPARTFLKWTDENFEEFAAMAVDRGLAAFGGM